MRTSFLFPTAIAGALLLGCGDHAGVTDPASDAAPSLGAEISRSEIPLVLLMGQETPPIAVLIGVSLEHFPAFCAGADPETVADAMIVTHPTAQGVSSEHVLITSQDMSVLVWPVDLGSEPSLCDLQPFVGTVHFTFNDNEGQFFETAPGANAFLTRFVGTVTDQASGQRYHLQGATQFVILPDGTFRMLPVPFLRLRPIGG